MRILLLRHGQYKKLPREVLTALGRKQARRAGKRLREYSIDELLSSTMPRAQETARLVCKELGWSKCVKESDLLRECVPGFPRKWRKRVGVTEAEVKLGLRQ